MLMFGSHFKMHIYFKNSKLKKMNSATNFFKNAISMKELIRKAKELKVTGTNPVDTGSCGDMFSGIAIQLFGENQNPALKISPSNN